MNIKKFLTGAATSVIMLGAMITPALADSLSVNFEPTTYTPGSISGQDGWSNAVNPSYDQAIVSNTYGFASFDSQSFRISDAVTSGSFGDWVFAKPLTNSVGETAATAGSFSVGTKQNHFETQFDLASTLPTFQPGMHVSVSPDRGDGSRMSYLRFEDQSDGIHVFFDDVTDAGPLPTVATFNESDIATLTRAPHTIKLTMDTLDGPSNDVVKVWIDGILVKTGTSWEDYYRFDPEASAEQSPRIIKTVIIQARGSSSPGNAGNGFLFDNLSLTSSTSVAPSVPTILSPLNNAIVTTSALNKVDWTDSTGSNPVFEYQYEAYGNAAYSALIYSSSWLTNSEIPTPGTPPGDYYVRVRARDSIGTLTAWSNGSTNPHKITVTADPTPTPDPFAVPAACQNITGLGTPIVGTNKSEVLNGTSGNDLIFALGGGDIVNGNGGDDCIIGGAGSDVLRGNNGNDVLLGEAGSDSLLGGQGADALYGGAGSDSLRGEQGTDTLIGDAGSDAANGGSENDTCNAEAETSCEL